MYIGLEIAFSDLNLYICEIASLDCKQNHNTDKTKKEINI